jgi:hypothetical protein
MKDQDMAKDQDSGKETSRSRSLNDSNWLNEEKKKEKKKNTMPGIALFDFWKVYSSIFELPNWESKMAISIPCTIVGTAVS